MLTCVLIFKHIISFDCVHGDGVLVHCIITLYLITSTVFLTMQCKMISISLFVCSYCELYSESMVLAIYYAVICRKSNGWNIFIYTVDIYIYNISGPSMVPWSMPHFTEASCAIDVLLLYIILWLLRLCMNSSLNGDMQFDVAPWCYNDCIDTCIAIAIAIYKYSFWWTS